ncbi:MAG: flagellar type III secretion system pore protein FliP [Deltaproteobacteria bacterium]|nr:flagellar type III secretion system pore protein FliP [Deltaproteobacteria bacterium]
MTGKLLKLVLIGLVLFAALSVPYKASAQTSGNTISVSLPFSEGEGLATPVKLMLFVTLLTFIPALVISATSFTRIVIVFSFLRQAMGMPQAPPNQILIGLSLFLTMAIMSPVLTDMNQKGLQPYLDGQINETQAMDEIVGPLRRFMFSQTRSSDINLMLEISKAEAIETFDDLPTIVLIPAFILSELKTAFQLGFMLYIPFLVMDMIVAMVLLSMGMMVLPPVVISLPFKIMLFVMANGWDLVVTSVIRSFQ